MTSITGMGLVILSKADGREMIGSLGLPPGSSHEGPPGGDAQAVHVAPRREVVQRVEHHVELLEELHRELPVHDVPVVRHHLHRAPRGLSRSSGRGFACPLREGILYLGEHSAKER